MTSALVNIPLLPQLPMKINHSFNTTYSPSINEKYYTPPISIDSHKPSSDSDSTSSSHNSSDDTDDEDVVNIPTKNVHFNDSKANIDIQLKLENDEAEFFAYIPSKNSIKKSPDKPLRKRDKIRLAFHKKFHRSQKTDTYNIDNNEWDEILVESLVSMQQDVHEIIDGFDKMDEPITDDIPLNSLEAVILTKPHLSFCERQREKLEMMRIAQMFHPPNLLTFHSKESPYPYTDIIEPYNFNFLRVTKRIPDENLFIQHKPFRHRKFLYRTQRGLLRIRHDLRRIKRHVYGKRSIKSYEELPSLDIQNYRNRLEKTLFDVRKQINEYDRIHSLTNNPRKSITQVIEKMNTIDPKIQAQIEEYQTKYRPIQYIDKKHTHELNSAPYIPRRTRYHSTNTKQENEDDHRIDPRFDPSTFADLNKEADEFFGSDKPFWDQPSEARLPLSSPSLSQESDEFILPSKPKVWDRSVVLLKSKRSDPPNITSKQSNENDSEFFDCISLPSLQRTSIISTDELESVEF